jgi:hypothetical protein
MRGTAAALVLLVLLALVPAAAARADDTRFSEYVSLGQLERTPAPLVPTRLPPVLENGDGVGTSLLYGEHGNVYELVYKHIAGIGTRHEHVDEALILHDYGAVSLARTRRSLGPTFTTSSTRVRGHQGYAVGSHFTTVRALMWIEDGHVYELATGTPKTIGMGDLRSTANSLQHLLGSFYAQLTGPADAEGGGLEVLVSERAVDLNAEWNATCTAPGAESPTARGGAVTIGWLPLSGGAFAPHPFAVASPDGQGPQWSGSMSGSASGAGGTITAQAAATLGAESCATGAMTVTLTRLPKLVKAA